MIAALWMGVAAARADAAYYCEIAGLESTVPASGATDVPIDLAPALVFVGDCGIDAPITLALRTPAQPEPVFEQEFTYDAFVQSGTAWLLEPSWGVLEPDTAYTVEITSSFAESRQFGFTTGSRQAEPLSGVLPGVSIAFASQRRESSYAFPLELELDLTTAGPDAGLFLVRTGDDARGLLVVPDGGVATIGWTASEWTREVCVTVVERDAFGTWHGPSDEACAEVEGARGCMHAPPWLGLLALAPALAIRRRR